MIWADDAVAVLRRIAREGGSFSDVVEALGGDCTRSMVAGKANRLGVKFMSPAVGPSARHAEACRKSWAEMTPEARAARVEATTNKAARAWSAQHAKAST